VPLLECVRKKIVFEMANKLLANKQRQNDDDERGLLALRE